MSRRVLEHRVHSRRERRRHDDMGLGELSFTHSGAQDEHRAYVRASTPLTSFSLFIREGSHCLHPDSHLIITGYLTRLQNGTSGNFSILTHMLYLSQDNLFDSLSTVGKLVRWYPRHLNNEKQTRVNHRVYCGKSYEMKDKQ